MIKSSLFVATFLLVSATVLAQPTDSVLSLPQCVEMAVQHNATMRIADNNVKTAHLTRQETFTKYFPEISAQGFGFKTHNYVLQYNALDLLNIELINHGIMLGVQAVQPIFSGGQIVNGNELAKIGEAVAALQRKQTENEVKLSVCRYYWQLATLKGSQATLQSALAMLDSLANQVNIAVNAGIVTRNELLEVELRRNEYAAKQTDLDNGIKLCQMVLSQYVGLPYTYPIEISAEIPEPIPPFPAELYINPAEALPQTSDYQLLQKQVNAKRVEKRMEIGRNLPTVAGGAGWYFHNVLDQGHNFGALMLTVNVPLSGWWSGSHAIKRRTLAIENARMQLDDLGDKLQIDMQSKWDNLTAAYRKLELAAQAIAQSEENLRLNQAFYKAGTITITALLDAQTLNQDAHNKYVAAFGDYRIATAAYLAATARL